VNATSEVPAGIGRSARSTVTKLGHQVVLARGEAGAHHRRAEPVVR
jgi:hypothetical protein